MKYHYHIGDLIFFCRADQLDVDCLKATLIDQIYNPINFAIKHGDTVIDIGAFIGDFSLYARKRGARVLAFEPFKENYKLLEENIKINMLPVETYPLAIMNEEGVYPLSVNRGNLGMTSMIHNYEGSETYGANAITLNKAFEDYSVGERVFIKFDCEGAEEFIFDDFKYWDKVDRIAGECRDEIVQAKLEKLFIKKGFFVSHFDNAHQLNIIYAHKI